LHGEAASIRIVEVRTVDVGIDIGGTKTHLRVHEVPGRPRDLIVPTANWRVRDLDKNAAALLGLARQIADGQEIGAVGAHGCDDASDCDAFQAAIARRAGFSVEVVNDAELLPAALGYENQIGIVVGTGSIAVCRDHKHGMMVAGGWGWIIGDEGSAPGLLREAARAASFHLERGGVLSEPLVMLKRSPSRTPRESVAPSRSLAGGRARPPCPPGVRGGEEGIANWRARCEASRWACRAANEAGIASHQGGCRRWRHRGPAKPCRHLSRGIRDALRRGDQSRNL
jgi:hypothetical protein